jgi:diketogulonate reductase-like aldo/keto reductase
LYGNQREVGEGLRKSGVPRNDVFVTTKVAFFPPNSKGIWMHNPMNEKGNEEAAIEYCLDQLKL